MRYLLLIDLDKAAPPPQKAEMEAILQSHKRFEPELQTGRKMVHTERLHGEEHARRVRLKAGQRYVTDGPFAETKEVLAALSDRVRHDEGSDRVGEKDPLREDRSVEVRPIWTM